MALRPRSRVFHLPLWTDVVTFMVFVSSAVSKIYNLKKQHSPTSLMRPDVSSSGSSAWTFLIDLWTSSLMCSMPTTLPLGPVYKQQRETAIASSHVPYFTPPWMERVYSGKTFIQNSPFLQSRQWGIHFLNPHLVQTPLQLVCHLTVPKHEHAVKPGPQENIQLIVWVCDVCLFFWSQKKSVTHHVWCTDGRLVACDKKICRTESQHKSKLMKHLLFCNTLYLYVSTLTVRCICLQRVTKMRTYGLRRVCIRIVCGVDPSVCSQHGVEHSVGADDPMIWRTNDEAMALSWTGK